MEEKRKALKTFDRTDIKCDTCRRTLYEGELVYWFGMMKLNKNEHILYYCQECFYSVAGKDIEERIVARGIKFNRDEYEKGVP